MQKGQRAAAFDRHRVFIARLTKQPLGTAARIFAVSWQKNIVRLAVDEIYKNFVLYLRNV